MKTSLVLFFVLLGLRSDLRAALSQASAAGRTELVVDGVACGSINNVTGGNARAEVVTENPQGSGASKKHLANLAYQPLVMDVAIPIAPSLVTLINAFFANTPTSTNLVLTEYDYSGQAKGTPREALSCHLTEVRFPAFDATGKDVLQLTLVFAPESVRAYASTPPVAGVVQAKHVTAGNFRLKVDGLDATHVSLIEAFTVSQVAPNSSGETRSPGQKSNTIIPNLFISLAVTYSTDWNSWFEDFVIKGNSGDAQEKNGSLELLGTDLTTVLCSLQFSHLGAVTAVPTPLSSTDGIRKLRAELYCEGLTMSAGAAPAASSTPTKPGAETKPAGKETAATDGKTKPAATGKTDPAATTTTTATTTPSPTPTMVAGSKTVTPTPATKTSGNESAATVATNSADKGAHDPSDFPRPDGLVRKTYSAVRQKTYSQEVGIYSISGPIDPFEETYTKSLTASGWESASRLENDYGSGNTHQIILTWKKGQRTAVITMWQMKPDVGEVTANISTAIAPQ